MDTKVEAPARSRLSYGVAGLVAVALVAVAGGYGYHGDELYFLAAGRHLAWGYPDQPPLTPLVAHLMDLVAPDSLVVLRIPAAVAAGLTVLFVSLTAREMGGRPRAQLLAASAAAVSGLVLVPGHMLHTTTIDICLSAALVWLVVRVLRTGDQRLLLVAGAVLGLGLLNKYQIAAVALALVVGLALVGPRDLLRSPWFLGGAVLALALWAPNLWWQAQHGWPQIAMANLISERGGNGARLSFVPLQLVYVSPFLAPLWIAGLVRLVRTPSFRFLGVAYLLLAAAFIAAGGSALYLFGAYPALLAAGGLAVDGWIDRGAAGRRAADRGAADRGAADRGAAGRGATDRGAFGHGVTDRGASGPGATGVGITGRDATSGATGRGATGRRVTVGVLLGASAAFVAPLALPIVPLDRLSVIPVVRLNGLTAEQFGWPELAETVTGVYRALPAAERAHAVVLTDNFGEAAAVERYAEDGMRDVVYSGYRGYGDWGPPPETATTVVIVGPGAKADPPAWAVRACRGGVRLAARTDNAHGVRNKEQGGRVWVCTGLGESWASLWPGIRHLD